MRVVLIAPNYLIRDRFGAPSDPPIGLASVAAVAEAAGHTVHIVDANAEDLTTAQTVSKAAAPRPDVVGISCSYSPLHNPTLQLAEGIKGELAVPVVVGGNHATALHAYIMERSPHIDFVVRGEGERVVPRLLDAIAAGASPKDVPGITFRGDGKTVSTPDAELIEDLDSLPRPAYHLLPMDRYARHSIMTARGCPFDCSYCASNVVFGRRVRWRSPGSVTDEIEYLAQQYGDKRFWFCDDTFASSTKRAFDLIEELRQRDLGITWSCLTRANVITRALLDAMKASGCDYVSYGVESGNPGILERMGKRVDVEDILRSLALTREAGIRCYGFFIVGYPGETWDTVMDSYGLIWRSQLDGAAFNILIPLPGTRLMDELIGKGVVALSDIEWDYMFARTPGETYELHAAELASRWCELSAEELVEACQIGHRLTSIFGHVRSLGLGGSL